MKSIVNDLLILGFNPIDENGNQFSFQGVHQRFIAKVIDCNGPEYIKLFVYSSEIDMRPRSDNFGKPFVNFLKDCISEGSLERAIKRFDVERIQFFIGYAVPGIVSYKRIKTG